MCRAGIKHTAYNLCNKTLMKYISLETRHTWCCHYPRSAWLRRMLDFARLQGGNDHEIFESPLTVGHTVNGPGMALFEE